MKCFIYRYPKGAQISAFNPDLNVHENVDPVDLIETLAAEERLKHVRLKRTIAVCLADQVELARWKLIEPAPPFLDYLSYL